MPPRNLLTLSLSRPTVLLPRITSLRFSGDALIIIIGKCFGYIDGQERIVFRTVDIIQYKIEGAKEFDLFDFIFVDLIEIEFKLIIEFIRKIIETVAVVEFFPPHDLSPQ